MSAGRVAQNGRRDGRPREGGILPGAVRLPAPRELTCREVVELVTDYLEGALPRRERRRVERHLAGCENCSRYLEQFRTTIATVGRLPEESLAPEVRAELLDAFRAWRGRPPDGDR
jgi:anti-sigma factor RsiW